MIYSDLLTQTPRVSTDLDERDSKLFVAGLINLGRCLAFTSSWGYGKATSSDMNAAEEHVNTFAELIEAER